MPETISDKRPSDAFLAHGVVCVAAEAMDLSPRALRPALFAAFKHARELGLTMDAMETALAPPAPGAPSPTRAKAAR